MKIVESRSIWMTDFRFLNDRTELQYGHSLVASVLEEKLQTLQGPIAQIIKERFQRGFENPFLPYGIYIMSFCKEDMMLNQWRIYGRNTYAVSVCFRTSTIIYPDLPDVRVEIVKCIYNETEQRRLVNEAADLICSYILKLETENPAPETHSQIAANMLGEMRTRTLNFILGFKHPIFSEEKEYRAVASVFSLGKDIHKKYRMGTFGMAPYIALSPRKFPNSGLAIDSVTIGPCRHGAHQAAIVADFLQANDVWPVNVTYSDIPYRY